MNLWEVFLKYEIRKTSSLFLVLVIKLNGVQPFLRR